MGGAAAFAILFEASLDMRLFEAAFFSWFYMRFYMIRELAETVGDQSANFAFVSFFPATIREYLEPLVNELYATAGRSGVIQVHGTAATGTMLDKTTVYDRKKY